MARAGRRTRVLHDHQAAAQPAARRPRRRRPPRRRTSTPATNGSLGANVTEMARPDRPRDIVLLHDPQTAGMVDGLRASRRAGRVALSRRTRHAQRRDRRAHGRSSGRTSNRRRRLRVLAARVRAGVGRRASGSSSSRRRSTRSRPRTATSITRTVSADPRPRGLVSGARAGGPDPLRTPRRLAGTVRRHTGLIADGPPPPHDARLVLQVSRWDRLKDMAGVLDGFVKMAADGPRRRPSHARRAGRLRRHRRPRRAPTCWPSAEPGGATVPGVDPSARPPRLHPDGRRRRERHHHQRPAAPRLPGRAEEPRRGVRTDRHRGDVEGAADDRQPCRRDPGPDRRRARRAAHRRPLRPRCSRRGHGPTPGRPRARRPTRRRRPTRACTTSSSAIATSPSTSTLFASLGPAIPLGAKRSPPR